MKSPPQLSRRHVLRGLGACLSLPLLDAMLPRVLAPPSTYEPLKSSLGVQPRMICCYIPNGVNIMEWVPENVGQGLSNCQSHWKRCRTCATTSR